MQFYLLFRWRLSLFFFGKMLYCIVTHGINFSKMSNTERGEILMFSRSPFMLNSNQKQNNLIVLIVTTKPYKQVRGIRKLKIQSLKYKSHLWRFGTRYSRILFSYWISDIICPWYFRHFCMLKQLNAAWGRNTFQKIISVEGQSNSGQT